MNLTINIDIEAEIAKLPEKDREAFYDLMATEDRVIEHVMSQVVYGCTEHGSCGANQGGVIDLFTHQYPSNYMKARRWLLEIAPAAMREEFENFKSAITREREYFATKNNDAQKELRDMSSRYYDSMVELRRKEETIESLQVHCRSYKSVIERLERIHNLTVEDICSLTGWGSQWSSEVKDAIDTIVIELNNKV